MRGAPILATLLFSGVFVGCGGNRYNFARSYEAYGDEGPFLEREVTLSYEDVRRFPDRHADALVGWFGTVTAIDHLDEATGEARLALEFRRHQARHLCADERSSSCRLTVSERTHGPFQVQLRLRSEDLADGPDRLWTGSLIKVYGRVSDAGTEATGPLIEVEHYRHFPHGTYVTTAAARSMRR